MDRCECRMIHQERVDKALKKGLSPLEVKELAQVFKAIGDGTRIKILWALEDGEMCVCDLACYLGLSESAVSHQLRMLRQLHLVANRRQGPILYYRLNDGHIRQIMLVALEHVQE